MLYLLDTANLANIEKAFDLYPMDGVTTNPTIIAKENIDFIEHILKIRSIIGQDAMIHVQVLGSTAVEMIEEANNLLDKIGGNLYIKIPVTSQGIKAMKHLHNASVKITATAVFTALQALVAAKAGADFVAPYVNRSDNISSDGVGMVGEIVDLLKAYNFTTKVLAASFMNVQQVHASMKVGSHAVTLNLDTFENSIRHPLTDSSVDQFVKDWEDIYGKDKTTFNL
ncbi:MAG: fructose-6-phosphate aldolase [Vallitaleaceae bacterium]|nr:fructose-6-phosphate aldolase [Vallitaleaceae bacterium]